MESINGLPAHPLFVHAPVVLLPLTTLAMLILAVRPQLRRRSGLALAAATVVVLVLTQLAISSGLAFDEALEGAINVDDHEALANMTRNFLIVFVLAAIGFAVLDRKTDEGSPTWFKPASTSLVGLAAISSVLATIWMVRTGDEGAKLVWGTTLNTIVALR